MTSTRARARRLVRSFALLAVGLVGGGATLGLAPTAVLPSAGAATCTSAGGVSVVVDYRELGGSTVTACAPDGGGKSAAAVFASVGVSISYATRQPGFVCRINGVPASDPCVNASPANAYWGLWWSDGTTSSWTYATSGVGGQTVPAGGSVGWSWQQDRPSGSTVPPSVAPPVAPTATPSPSPTSSTPTPTSSPTPTGGTGGSGGSGGGGSGGGGGGTNGGSGDGQGGGKGGGTSPSATPTPTTSASPSKSPSASPSTPSASPLATESPSDSASSEPSEDPTVGTESPSDSGSSDPSEDPVVGTESPSDSTPSAAPGAGEATPDEPARIPAAVTWGVVGLLALAIVSSAWVARRRRGTGTP